MIRFSLWFMLCIFTLLPLGCSSTGLSESTSPNAAIFDPTTGEVPLPNILATATATDPITQYRNPASGLVGLRPTNVPLNPLEALAYENIYEVGGTHAVSGINAPIYLRFSAPLIPSTVTTGNIKVFQLSADSTSPTAFENNPLGFSDVSAMFSVRYTPGSTEVQLFPNFPLLPATRYLYLVTDRVKDAATSGSVTSSAFFGALKSTLPLTGPFAALEPIRANQLGSGNNIVLSGYAKVMDDLIAASSTSTVSSRAQIAVLGRFITTSAGFLARNLAAPVTSLLPVETALRSFAAGAGLGGLPGVTWPATATVTTSVSGAVALQSFWGPLAGGSTIPSSIGTAVLGSIPSADISMNPLVVRSAPTDINQAGNANIQSFANYSAATSVLQPFRSGTSLTGFYYRPRNIPYLYFAPAGTAPAGGWPLVIFQHGINGQKEQMVAVVGALTAAGYAVVAIDLPLHGELALAGHTTGTAWGQDFLAVGAPLATRTNIQQAAFNLDRLELVAATGGFAALAGAAPNPLVKPKYLSLSLGSIIGAYYLAGNTTLNPTPGQPPYTQASLDSDMKGLLNVPGARVAYLLQESVSFGPSLDAGLADKGIIKGTPQYQQFFLLTQTVLDPVDPATMTTPLPNLQSTDLLPSRLSGRILVQEATSTQFGANGVPLNGDLVIPNSNTRYFGNALGGRGVLGRDIAPGFAQVSYADGRLPSSFMLTLTGGIATPKKVVAATSAAATSPREGYFQFDQADVTHGFLIDPVHSPVANQLAQLQMAYYLGLQTPVPTTPQLVVDPTLFPVPLSKAAAAPAPAPAFSWQVIAPKIMKIFGNPR